MRLSRPMEITFVISLIFAIVAFLIAAGVIVIASNLLSAGMLLVLGLKASDISTPGSSGPLSDFDRILLFVAVAILAPIGEELGWIGIATVLALFAGCDQPRKETPRARITRLRLLHRVQPPQSLGVVAALRGAQPAPDRRRHRGRRRDPRRVPDRGRGHDRLMHRLSSRPR